MFVYFISLNVKFSKLGPDMEDKKPLILTGLKPVLQETNNKVNKFYFMICKYCIEWSSHWEH